MAGITEKVFSDAEVRKIGIKIGEAAKADINECVGTCLLYTSRCV